MNPSLLESYDAVAFVSVVEQRLAAAATRLGKARGLSEEKGWLQAAATLVSATLVPYAELLQKALRLPELETVRAEHARQLQEAAVEAVERLQAGITFHAGSRAPLLDSLFGKLKWATLRRADTRAFEKFCVDFDKRLTTQYAKRQLVTPAFEFATPVLEQVALAFTGWRQSLAAEPLPEAEATELCAQLHTAAEQVKLPLRQARLLAEAALAPLDKAFEESGLGAKQKKRTVKALHTPEAAEPEAVVVAEVEEPARVAAKKVKKARPMQVAAPTRRRAAGPSAQG